MDMASMATKHWLQNIRRSHVVGLLLIYCLFIYCLQIFLVKYEYLRSLQLCKDQGITVSLRMHSF